MSVIDSREEQLEQVIAHQAAELAQLRQVVLWQAEGSRPDGIWSRPSDSARKPAASRSYASQGDAGPLTRIKAATGHRERRSIPLPSEVLAEIASCVADRRDLVSLGKATFQLLEVAMRELMAQRPVRLNTPEQVVAFFCHRGRLPDFLFWNPGNQKRLRPALNFTHITHLELCYLDASQLRDHFLSADRAMLPESRPPINANGYRGEPVLEPKPEDRVPLTSLTFVFPSDDEDDGSDSDGDEDLSWAHWRIADMFNPANLILLRTPTFLKPLVRLPLSRIGFGIEDWPRFKRCICIGVVPDVTVPTGENMIRPEQSFQMRRDGVPDLVLFLVAGHRSDMFLGTRCAAWLGEKDLHPHGWDYRHDPYGPMRWNVQCWLPDEDAVARETKNLTVSHPHGITHLDGERFGVDWRTWERGTNGDDRHTRLFGLPYDEQGWLSEAWFKKHNL